MAFANSIILYNAKINHNGLFGCDFGGSGAARDSVMGGTNALATYKFGYNNMTYMRKDKVIVVDENADVLDNAGVNYCRFINTDFSSSRFIYAFVDDIEYVAPQTSRLHIRTDCWMTWFDRIVPNQCFVEREHVADDRFLKNYVPENLSTGELRRKRSIALLGQTLRNDESKYIAAFNVATDPNQLELGEYLGAIRFGGVVQGTWWYGVEIDNIMKFAKYLISKNATILSINMVSKNCCWLNDGEDVQDFYVYHLRDVYPAESGYDGSISIYVQGASNGDPTLSSMGNARGITNIDVQIGPWIETFKGIYHNLKLLQYPFTAFELFTFNNSSSIIPPHKITYDTNSAGAYTIHIKDTLVGGSTPSETAIMRYSSDNSIETAYCTHQTFSNFPTLSVTADGYDAFMARNANSIKYQKDIAERNATWNMNHAIINMGAGISTLNSDKMLQGYEGIRSAGDQLDAVEAKMADAKMAPDSVIGQSTEGALFQLDKMGIYFGIQQIGVNMLEIADSFFDRYGYAVNLTKTPQWNSRPKFNYIKTGGANISGEIPKSDKEEINRLLDTGMTIWHSAADYGIFDGANNLAPTR